MSMITTAGLTCGQCGNFFQLNLNEKPAEIKCPFCQSEMASDMIESVYNAASTVSDLNYHFRKYKSERNEALFSLSVEEREVHLPIDDIE